MSNPVTQRRHGLTLIEMLVATTVTLIIVFGMVEMFRILGAQASEGRAVLEMSGQLRSVVHMLQRDLDGITAPVRPWPNAAAAPGYFEIYEGLSRDKNPVPGNLTPNTAFGDIDDVLMFTSRSQNEPFKGRWQPLDNNGNVMLPQTITSSVAEIVWFTKRAYNDVGAVTDVALYRRALLVAPQLGQLRRFGPFQTNNAGLKQLRTLMLAFHSNNDISCRIVPELAGNNGGLIVNIIANSLEDLTKRESRFAHYSVMQEQRVDADPANDILTFQLSRYPYPLQLTPLTRTALNPLEIRSSTSLQQLAQSGVQEGEDLIAQKVTAFDVKVYDPYAPILQRTNDFTTFYVPGDPAWDLILASGQLGTDYVVSGHGTFVDLWYDRNNRLLVNPPANLAALSRTFLSISPAVRSGFYHTPRPFMDHAGMNPTYDTWTVQYENDGLDQNRNGETGGQNPPIDFFSGLIRADHIDNDGDGLIDELIDEGANNLDDDGVNGVDDIGERETSPPYPIPLRGIKIVLRMWDPDSRQVRQVSLVANLTPE